jgi:thiol-disulfide isomerase/thioredoxin
VALMHCAVVANFYAPWCPWCQRLEPTWEAVTAEVHKRYPEHDGRIRFGKVGCADPSACLDERGHWTSAGIMASTNP